MAYTDLTSTFVYRGLLTHQQMDQVAENDKVFNDLLTAVTDFANFLHFDNTKGIKGEVAATGSYKKLAVLDASNHVQLGEAGTEVRVPADPTNVLGVATKQYVDGVQMFQTQPIVSLACVALTTILDLTATTRTIVHAIVIMNGSGGGTGQVKVTVDGVVVVNDSVTLSPARARALTSVGLIAISEFTTQGAAAEGNLIDIRANSTLKIEAAGGTGASCIVLYSKIP